MSRYSAPIDIDPERRIKKIFHRLEDGDWAYETIQDVEPILDANKWNQSFNHMSGGVRRVASIPFIIIEKWRNELGVDYWNPNHQDKVDQLLNSSEWQWLRTDNSVL